MYRWIIVLAVSIVLFFLKIKLDGDVVSTLYTVSGIMFSVGISSVVNFDLGSVVNEKALNYFSNNLKRVRGKLILYFSLSTCFYLCFDYLLSLDMNLEWIKRLLLAFFSSGIGFSIIYFLLNFLDVHKLKDEITKQVRKEKNK